MSTRKCILLLVIISTSVLYYYVGFAKMDLRNVFGARSSPIVGMDRISIRRGKGNRSFESGLTFMETMKTFPWKEFKSAVDDKNMSKIQDYCTVLELKMLPYITMPPTVAINESCIAPPLQIPSTPFTPACRRLQKPRKVGMLIQFGFDVNALEIHLHELNAVVDKFFLIEAVQSHSKYTSTKPLVWESVRDQDRFVRFSEKVVHLIMDDASILLGEGTWGRETRQERVRWNKFLQWNGATKYFSSNDVLGFGDTDEIPNRNNVYFLKNCELPSDPVDIGLWFPLDGLNSVFPSDWPIKEHPYTIANPTFWTLGKGVVKGSQEDKFPNRLRGASEAFLLGGIHLSRNTYPPHFLVRLFTHSEAQMYHIKKCVEIGMLYAENKIEKATKVSNDAWNYPFERVIRLNQFRKTYKAEAEAIVKMPWFLGCNLKRYPSFDLRFDERLNVALPTSKL